MRSPVLLFLGSAVSIPLFVASAAPATMPAAEYSTHFDALTKLSIAVAQAMPADQYGFRPHL